MFSVNDYKFMTQPEFIIYKFMLITTFAEEKRSICENGSYRADEWTRTPTPYGTRS